MFRGGWRKTSVTKYKRTHRWNTTSWSQEFWKDVDFQDSQASRNNELQDSHNVFNNFFPGFSKILPLDWENRLWSWTSVAGNGQTWYFCKKMLELLLRPVGELIFSFKNYPGLDKPLKQFEKVVSGRDLHGVTSRKRWEDCYIFSLWGNGQEIVRKRLNYPKFVKNCSLFTISQRIAVRKTTELLEVQNMSKGGWKKQA